MKPEVQRAVVDLLKAEQEFLRAWGDWKVHPREAPYRKKFDTAERDLEEAQEKAFRLHEHS